MLEEAALRVWESEGGHLCGRDGWTRAAALVDLPDGTAGGVTPAGPRVCLVRSDGRATAATRGLGGQ